MKRFWILLALLWALTPLCAGAESAVIPSGATGIDAEAFAGCISLSQITIPASVQTIGKDAFADSELPLLIRTQPQSAAMAYAIANHIDFQADTTYRALLIGQSAYTGGGKLYGTLTDVKTMAHMLTGFQQTPYQATTCIDLTGEEIKTAISSAFAAAQPQDVSLLYYSGHGLASGSLCGVDGSAVSAQALRACLDEIPGRKIVIVDACYSGALIGRAADSEKAADGFTDAFLSAFSWKSRSNLAADQYFVMTAAHSSQQSVEVQSASRSYGLFTYYLAKGCGYDQYFSSFRDRLADANGDQVLTFDEAFQYAKTKTRTHAQAYQMTQEAQVWPEDCDWFGFLR